MESRGRATPRVTGSIRATQAFAPSSSRQRTRATPEQSHAQVIKFLRKHANIALINIGPDIDGNENGSSDYSHPMLKISLKHGDAWYLMYNDTLYAILGFRNLKRDNANDDNVLDVEVTIERREAWDVETRSIKHNIPAPYSPYRLIVPKAEPYLVHRQSKLMVRMIAIQPVGGKAPKRSKPAAKPSTKKPSK